MDIKLLILDVDGTLTDGCITYGENIELKTFDVKDGLVLAKLSRLGINVVFLTGRKSEAVARRAADLGATAIQNISNKAEKLCKLLTERDISSEQVAYIGDDLNDYAAMKLCGFKACPSDAAPEIKAIADYVSPFAGGHGAVRDIIEKLLKDNGQWEKLLEYYSIIPLSS